ncbi:MAG: DUF1256 domain-containing protein [Clostridia bacterium]|nr:DUF1256 domain-containing protein [Clostridia bacterium]
MNYVFLCVGSSKVVCDSFSCFVGSFLKKKNIKAFVYGTLNNPINSLNLDNFLTMLDTYHKDDYIVVVDTRLGKGKNIKMSLNIGSLEVSSLNLKRKIGNCNFTLDIPFEFVSKIDLKTIIKYSIKASENLFYVHKMLLKT